MLTSGGVAAMTPNRTEQGWAIGGNTEMDIVIKKLERDAIDHRRAPMISKNMALFV